MKSLFKKIVISILLAESKAVIRKYKPTIIAVTGSVGKTSTKDAIYALLAGQTHIRKSEKSFNSEIGVPLTILGCQNGWSNPMVWLGNIHHGLDLILKKHDYPKCLILEVGADHPGDIKKLTSWLKPDVAIITAVSKVPVHVEFFSSPQEVLDEKLHLARAVKPTGTLVLPAGDPDILAVRSETPALGQVKCITFAMDAVADVTVSDGRISYTDGKATGMLFKINSEGNSIPAQISGVIGKQSLFCIAAAIAAARAFGASLPSVIGILPSYEAPRGRMNVIPGIHGSTLIDDTYNASPDAVTEALKVLGEVEISTGNNAGSNAGTGRKIAVLGDMMELGSYSLEQHKKIGALVAELFAKSHGTHNKNENMLVTVGIRARDIAVGAHEAGLNLGQIKNFNTSAEAGEFMKTIVETGDVVLIKGSQSPRMERVTKALLADPSKAKDLLVRQDAEWQIR
jgi:UDP-N-acetylmuramoyl-tripeptide--D-alanyl-D-alanine ligase